MCFTWKSVWRTLSYIVTSQNMWDITTTLELATMSILSHNYHIFVCGKKIKDCLNNIQVYNTVWLAIITMVYIMSPELVDLIAESLYHLTNISPFPPPPQALATTIPLSGFMSLVFLDSIYKWNHIVLVISVWLENKFVMVHNY